MSSLRPGRILLTLVALLTSTGCYIADWNETHIYNAAWTGHAKFHNGQTMSMGLLLGIAALYYLYAHLPSSSPSSTAVPKKEIPAVRAAKRDAALRTLHFVVLLDALYWVTQASAYAYPGTTAFDVMPGTAAEAYDWLLQAKIEVTALVMTAAGWWLEKRRLEAEF